LLIKKQQIFNFINTQMVLQLIMYLTFKFNFEFNLFKPNI